MVIGTGEVRMPPQMLAACWKQLSRCCPTVVPGLPPTGAAAVGSLKPSPAPSRLMMTIVEDACDEPANAVSHSHASAGATGAWALRVGFLARPVRRRQGGLDR